MNRHLVQDAGSAGWCVHKSVLGTGVICADRTRSLLGLELRMDKVLFLETGVTH